MSSLCGILYESVVGSKRTSEYFLETKKHNDLKFLILTKNYKIQNHFYHYRFKISRIGTFFRHIKSRTVFRTFRSVGLQIGPRRPGWFRSLGGQTFKKPDFC